MLQKIKLLFPILCCCCLQWANAQTLSIPLNQHWQFHQVGKDQWYEVQAPTGVHEALFAKGVIPDPFYRDNETQLQWIEKEDWEFRDSFDVPAQTLAQEHLELVFKGLDTYADVYLNDQLLFKADNMFRTWTADVKNQLKEKGNQLRIYFHAPGPIEEAKQKEQGYELPGGLRTQTRKAAFHYGWDWGPRFVTCGIWRPIEIRAWSNASIRDVHVSSTLKGKDALVLADVEIEAPESGLFNVQFGIGGQEWSQSAPLQKGSNTVRLTGTLKNPELWWCNGMGAPHRYPIYARLQQQGKDIDRWDGMTGIRTIELVTDKDKKGETFYFKLNGVPVFMKGANYIPQDIFQSRVTLQKTRKLLGDAVAANMNMLRVWGGGIYEEDGFYDTCDSLGLLVWQDFMFACAMYPGDPAWMDNVKQEAIENVRRLRNHPCIALWCGNNENAEGWARWGWQSAFDETQKQKIAGDYQKLFDALLPAVVRQYSPGAAYWESSPRFGRGDPRHQLEGDAHYWGVWHDAEPFSMFEKKVPRFMSEYGFQSFPEMKTIESFTQPEDLSANSKIMLVHQKHPRGNKLIAEYMNRDYRFPDNFEDFVYISQLLQAEGIRTGIEAHRRGRPYCMGTLYWQLNDCWQVASWSGIDNFGRWKALHYYAAKSYRPVIVSPVYTPEYFKVYVVSDLPKDTNAVLEVTVMDFDGNLIGDKHVKNVRIKAGTSRSYFGMMSKRLTQVREPEELFVYVRLKNGDEVLSERTFYLLPIRDLKLPHASLTHKVERTEGGYYITLQSNVLAKNVMLSCDADGFFSDNYFDVLPDKAIRIKFNTPEQIDDFEKQLKIRVYNH